MSQSPWYLRLFLFTRWCSLLQLQMLLVNGLVLLSITQKHDWGRWWIKTDWITASSFTHTPIFDWYNASGICCCRIHKRQWTSYTFIWTFISSDRLTVSFHQFPPPPSISFITNKYYQLSQLMNINEMWTFSRRALRAGLRSTNLLLPVMPTW